MSALKMVKLPCIHSPKDNVNTANLFCYDNEVQVDSLYSRCWLQDWQVEDDVSVFVAADSVCSDCRCHIRILALPGIPGGQGTCWNRHSWPLHCYLCTQ